MNQQKFQSLSELIPFKHNKYSKNNAYIIYLIIKHNLKIIVVQLLNCVQLSVNPWPAACQASLFFTVSCSLLKLMSIELVMPSNHLILCHPLLFLPSMFSRIRSSDSGSAILILDPPQLMSCIFGVAKFGVGGTRRWRRERVWGR